MLKDREKKGGPGRNFEAQGMTLCLQRPSGIPGYLPPPGGNRQETSSPANMV